MPANPSHAGVKRLWRRPLLASHFDYKTHESAARRRRRPKLSQTSNPKHRRRPRQRATLAAPATRPEIPTVRRKLARTRPPGTGPGPPGCRRPLGRREISLFVKFGLRRGGDAGGWGREAVPSGPAAHSIRSTPAGTGCAGVAGGGHDPSRPAAPPGTPGPNFRLASFKSPRVPHLLLCLLRGAPPGWRYRRPRLSAPQPRKFDKDRGRGRDRDPLAEARGRRAISGDPGPWPAGRRPEGRRGGRPGTAAGRAATPGREPRAGGAAAGCGCGEGRRAGPALRPPPPPAPTPAASPRPGLLLPTSRLVLFVPVCCGDSSPGRAIPPAPVARPAPGEPGAPRAPLPGPGDRRRGPSALGAAAGRRAARAAGAAKAAVGRWPAAAAGLEGAYLPAVEPVLADIALDHEAVHVVRLPAHTVHRRGRGGRRGPARSRYRHGCRGGSSCCSRGHRRRRSGHL